MVKNKIFIHFFLLAGLITLLAGCGGGKDKPKVQLSADFMGLELGYKQTYHGHSFVEGEETIDLTVSWVIVEEVPEYQGVFKKVIFFGNEQSISDGDYIGKNGDSYYDHGEWGIDDESGEPYDDLGESGPTFVDDDTSDYYNLLLKNPIPIEPAFKSCQWGTYIRQEKVTVPAGTFDAWVFQEVYDEPPYVDTDITWFVPYMGMVKYQYVGTVSGQIMETVDVELTSTSFQAITASSTVKSTAKSLPKGILLMNKSKR